MTTTDLTTATPAIVAVPMMDAAEAREAIAQIRAHLDGARKLLLDLEEREGWRALGYPSWRACAVAEFGQSQAYLYRQLAAGKIEQALDSPIGEIPESQLRPLAQLDTPDEQRQAWQAASAATGGKPTAKAVQAAVEAIRPKPTPAERDANGKFMPPAPPDLASAATDRLRKRGWNVYRVGDVYRLWSPAADNDRYETDAAGVRAAARILEDQPDLTPDQLMDAVNALDDGPAPAPLRVAFRHSHDRHETDCDDDLHARLTAAGYRWESAAVTPDGRWHHLISFYDASLARREQTRMRREGLANLLSHIKGRFTDVDPEEESYPLPPIIVVSQRADPNKPDPKEPPPAPAIPADIAQAAARFGLAVTPADDGYLLAWPEDDPTQLVPLWPDTAREWLRDEAPGVALRRLDAALERDHSDLFRDGYFWRSAAPPVIKHNDGWTGEAPTPAGCLTLAQDRYAARQAASTTVLSTPAAGTPLRQPCRSCGETLLNGHFDGQCSLCYRGERLTLPRDARDRAIVLLKALEQVLPALPAPESIEDLSVAIADLNECVEGEERTHWLRVGWALLDMVADEVTQ